MRGLIYLVISDDVEQRNDIRSARQVLQDLDLPLDLLLLDRLQHLDDALLVVDDIDAFEDFRVFPSPCNAGLILVYTRGIEDAQMQALTDFAYYLVVLQHAPGDVHAVIVPV